ncbi:unnamed protein product [Microthlaspi erraticum]|uniref:SWIM-type domain-containing protein n=1 Tax=Microthlaspi erraticum TaxID=1685480 RepID=A0A6D2JK20_9BRAS|nr:unnamed protein product [Microthlaspi erraticum]
MDAELPKAEHHMCARHIYANWKKQGFSRSEYKNLFWGVAYSYTEGEYEANMELVKAYDPSAYHALLVTEPHRSMPVINLLEEVRRQAMRRVSRRFLKAERCETIVTPITMGLFEKSRLAVAYCSTTRSSKSIPCKHAICILDDNQDDPVRYVPKYYYTDVMKKTYDDNIKPVNGAKMWRRTHKPPVGIPEMRKPRDHLNNRDRRKEPIEDLQNAGKSTRHGRIPHCSRCKQAGHIKSSCKKKDIPKPPTKPRKRRKAPTDTSSSQPLPPNATGEAEVSGCAPQPSVSTKKVKPHVKKAPKGRPLRVKKTIPVPYVVGTFWSPYTNHQFEVFGDRVYDRSGLDPQAPQDPSMQPPEDTNMQPPQNPNMEPREDPNM